MSVKPTVVPVFLQLLADRQLHPGALLLKATGLAVDVSESLLQVVMHADFAAIATRLVCLMQPAQTKDWSELQLQCLQQAGCQWLDLEKVFVSDAPTQPVLPPFALWLQGDWVTAPPGRPTASQSTSRALALKLVQLVANDADTRDIEDVFRQDPALSYHLLRLVNSVGMGTSRRITSFSQAILMLGRQQLRRWLNLMLFSARDDDHRAAMLQARVTLRARRLELLAKQAGLDRSDQELAFMAGMFSMLGILFGMPLPEIFKPLQISDVLEAAVLRHEGDIGDLLRLSECADRQDTAALRVLLVDRCITVADFNLINLQACHWMISVVGDPQGKTDD